MPHLRAACSHVAIWALLTVLLPAPMAHASGASRAAPWDGGPGAPAVGGHGHGSGPAPSPGAGAGATPPTPDTPPDPPTCHGMADYSFIADTGSLSLTDTPVGYSPAVGPSVFMQMSYLRSELTQPKNFTYTNFGHKWSSNWVSFIQDDPENAGKDVVLHQGGGGALKYFGYSKQASTFRLEKRTAAVLTLRSLANGVYVRTFPDGSSEIFSASDGTTKGKRRIFLTKRIDPQGNAVTLRYDSQMRLTQIVDAVGQITEFSYGLTGQPFVVTAIKDPFGRSASFAYDATLRLVSITDVIGLQSKFAYDGTSGVISSLTTPYGTTTFTSFFSDNVRSIQATDPLGHTERLLVRAGSTPAIARNEAIVPEGMNVYNDELDVRNSFYWDSHAFAVAEGSTNVFASAYVTHWSHGDQVADYGTTSYIGTVPVSILPPLEGRIWINHAGQIYDEDVGTFDGPVAVGRVLDNTHTDLTTTAYNALGLPVSQRDAAGRVSYFVYGNDSDLQAIQQKVGPSAAETIAQFLYNSRHRPIAMAGPSNHAWAYTYNARGQVTSATDPLGHVTQYAYDSRGYLTTITNANGKTAASFEHDGPGRITAATDSEGYRIAFTYDALDRIVSETYPDATSRRFVWNKLDLTSVTDRQGRKTTYTYDAARNLLSETNPQGNVTSYEYWENGILKSLTDPRGNKTRWDIDVEGRVTAKTFADSSSYAYDYDPRSGRLVSVINPQNQQKDITYTLDGKVAAITYFRDGDTTPDVGFSYDAYYPRLTSMTDGTGSTAYSYRPVGSFGALQLAGETHGTPSTKITYGYDALGRMTSREVAGAKESIAYDALGRPVRHASPLGAFGYTYLGETDQLSRRGTKTFVTQFQYEGNTGDRRLAGIINSGLAPDFRFSTLAEGDYDKITEKNGASVLSTWANSYDAAGRLTQSSSTTGQSFPYGYDASGNPTTYRNKHFTYNILNQVKAYGYDLKGNRIKDGSRSYSWDAENRLLSVTDNDTGKVTRYAYDGFGRRTMISGPKTGTTYYLWCGTELCAARNAGGKTVNRYFAEGEGLGTAADLLYATDQIGSVRAAVAKDGTVKGATSFDPYGIAYGASGTAMTDYRYAGLFYDRNTGLDLSFTRAYDPQSGQWVSRDPIGERGGLNLYQYSLSNPITYIDSNGTNVLTGIVLGGEFGTLIPGVGNLAGALVGGSVGAIAGYWAIDEFGNIFYNKPPSDAHDPNGAKAPGKPGEAEGFCDPPNGEEWGSSPSGEGYGWKDKDGNVYQPTGPKAHGGPHWDVVDKHGNGIGNLYPGGKWRMYK